MITTERLTIEIPDEKSPEVRQFKAKCVTLGITYQQAILSLIDQFNKRGGKK